MLTYRKQHDAEVEAPLGAPPVVILPGFGNNSTDYEAPFGDPESAVATALKVGGWARRLAVGRAGAARCRWQQRGGHPVLCAVCMLLGRPFWVRAHVPPPHVLP